MSSAGTMAVTPEQALRISGIPFAHHEGQWFFVKCPFHNGESDDLEKVHGRVNPDNGVFKCFGGACGHTTSLGNFLSAVLKKPAYAIMQALNSTIGDKNEIPSELVEGFHLALIKNKEYQERLRNKHGITFDEIVKFKLGIQGQRDQTFRVTIPITVNGNIVNIRRYSYHDPKNKLINWKGNGKADLYTCCDISKEQDIYITEGEFKAIILSRFGFPSCASTGGCDSWNAEWTPLFKDKHVVIVYDTDKAGRHGAEKLCKILSGVAASIRNVLLDVPKDTNDYFLAGKTAEDFRKLCIATQIWEAPKAPEPQQDDPTVYDTSLADSSLANLHNKRIKTTAVVSAKDTAPYIIPTKLRTICKADKEYCLYCHVSSNLGFEFEVKTDDAALLDLIRCDEKHQKQVLKKLGNIYPNCKACQFESIESVNVEEIRLIPQISVSHSTGEMVVRKAYSIGHGIETNTAYEVTARVCVEPDSQHATLIAYSQDKSTDDLDTFELSHDLSVFQPSDDSVEALEAKLNDIYEDLENNVTKIYKRRDMHMFIDIVFHSALYIPFQGKNIKGWIDALLLGDSGQGKTEASISLSKHYRAGERVDTKRASVAGLLGGCVESAKRWFIQWGTIPLNDRRLVFLEECKGMSVESLGVLTDMRSSGIAEIQKIERARTNARTRLLWISNVRSSGRTLSSYNYGVDAVSELIGNPEDIRRFDMVMCVATGEVAIETINQSKTARVTVPHVYTNELTSHLVMWAWSRKENSIVVTPEAEQVILDVATKMGKAYSSKCPVVEPSDQRHKILRIATAIAARTFSTEDGETLIVRDSHVLVAERFLDRIYKAKAFGYWDYSASQRNELELKDIEEVKTRIRNLPNAADTVQAIIETDGITPQTLVDCTEWMKDQASELLGFLVRKQALKPLRRGGYRKTAAFTDLLKALDRAGLKNETLHTQMENSRI